MLAQDPLEEIDLRNGSTKRTTYISTKLDPKLKVRVIELLRENKDCFAWDYDEMPGLKRDLVELKLPIKDETPKDEYLMPVAEMLVDSTAGYEYLSMLDGYSGYNQIFIAEEDVSKTAFRCPRARDFMGFVVHKKGIEINQNKTKAIMETKAPSTKKELQSLLGKINFLRRFISNLSGRTQAFSPLLRLKQGKFEWNDEHQKAFDKIKHYLTNPPILAPPCGKKPMRLYISASDTTIDFDVIKYMLSKPIMHSRIGKWALALTEYSLTFMPLREMKGQIVSDFIVDHAVVENPQLQVELKPWRLFCDGSMHKDGSGVGIMLVSPDGIQTKLKYRIEGPLCSNNEAEYEALIAGLEALLLKNFEYIDIKHVPRIKNQEANDLAQIASGYRISKGKLEELVEVRGKAMAARLSPTDLENTQLGYASKEEFEVLAIDTLIDIDWRNPIINYLKDPSTDTERKTKYRALSYVLTGNELFKKTPEGILLKCLGENEAYLALSSVHSGARGAHQAGHKMKWLLFRYGMYWPIMLKDWKKPKNWHKTLDQALWACRTSPKEATNTTPFQLTFGHDAVLPVEIYLQSVRIQRQGEIPSDLYWEMMINELVDLDEERLHVLEVLRRQKERVARAYNKRVKGKTFTMNDLVWKVMLPMDQKNKALEKWSPH
ncbi:uncharacterized protein LOC127104395 [Lathyrus oleraceus]|uniref:uncharacterized protein LOC127104395 n=1 Tax=Pisum sativum TaxID=3888 RepID=UPI0021CFA1C1|nr:uncharacterized protein LOC127104395 [Pisum sativum]